jgi:hypothetical protein
MARRLEVEIVGDSRSLERAFDRSAKSASGFNAELAGTEQRMVRVGAARGKAVAGLRIAGVGLAAGFAISTATRAVAELREALVVTGEEAETTTGRIRNISAALLGGDLIGAYQAWTKETKNFTQAEVEAVAATREMEKLVSEPIDLTPYEEMVAELERVRDSAELTAAALAAVPAITETPVALRLREARAGTTGRASDDITALDLQIAQKTEALARLKKLRAIEGTNAAVDEGIIKILQERKALVDLQNKLIDAINKGKRKRGAEAIEGIAEAAQAAERQRRAVAALTTARRDRRLARFFAGIERRMFREVEGQPLRAQAATLGAIAEQIRGQLQITKGTQRRLELEDRLISVLRQQQDVYAQITAEIEAANQLLKDRAEDIKSAVLERLERRRTDVLNRRALADAKEALRIARLIGGPKGIQEALRGVQDVRFDILRAQIERAPATLTAGGVFTLGGVITINVNGVTDPEKVAAAVAAALQRRTRRMRRQRRGLETAA